MDETTGLLSAYAATLSDDELTEDAVHGIARCVVDAMACALAAYPMHAMAAPRALAGAATGDPPSHVFFSGEPTTPDLAAFANSFMVRYLDYNDTYLAKRGGHPSDTIPAVLAAAEIVGATGREAVLGMVVAYEVFCALADADGLSVPGFGATVSIEMASALGAGKLLGLDQAGLANALALAMAGGLTTGGSRLERLSMWRAGATANAARNGVFAALAASRGITGPHDPFAALMRMARSSEEAVGLPPLGGRGRGFNTARTHMKAFPAEYHAQAPIWAALEVRERIRAEDLAELRVDTYAHTMGGIGTGGAKWEADDPDTALHSLPYLVAVALADGDVTPAHFTPERLRDPRVREVMGRVSVREDPELTALYPEVVAARVTGVARDGTTAEAECRHPKGHTKNAFSDGEISEKFRRCAGGVLPPDAIEPVLGRLWALDREGSVGGLLAALRVSG